jgi:hypothetical protein
MDDLITSGRVADLALAVLILEGVGLALHHRLTGQGLSGPVILSMLVPGALLMLALRGSLTSAPWTWIASCLSFALIAHVWDICRRMRDTR